MAMLAVTYVVAGLAVAYVLRLPVVYAMIGAVLPQIDAVLPYRFPFDAYGVLHTPLFAVFLGALLYLAINRRDAGYALMAGVLVHLGIDTITTGIMWLYPFTPLRFSFGVGAPGPVINIGVVGVALVGMAVHRYHRTPNRWMRGLRR